ncbi:MAG: D-aminoacylase [Chloroflexi bacterium]|nr:D-aminoacylase [Chloroflexota bacterium]
MADLTILLGGVIHAGRGPARPADVLLDGDRVAAVAPPGGLPVETGAAEILDLRGLHLAPGFVDMHSHSDTALIAEPENTAKTRQGITLDVIGQDGLGVAPFDAGRDGQWRATLLGLTGHRDLPWTWCTFDEHLAAIEAARPATNVAALVTFGAIRNAVIGLRDRPTTIAERGRMTGLVADAMAAGAFGMSVGLVYLPAVFASRDELVAAFSVVGRGDGLMVVHLRSQGDAWLDAIDEAIGIAREAQVALHVSHVCSLGSRNWSKIPRALERFEAARASGLPVTFDQHPYTAASTVLAQVLPPWVTEGGPAAMRSRLAEDAVRDRIRTEIRGHGHPGWENYAGLAGWDAVQIAGVGRPENRWIVGRTIGDVAAERDLDPLDITADLLAAEEDSIPMVLLGLYDDDGIGRILRAPGGSIGTDGVIAEHPHPRLFGSTARVLGHYVRDLRALSLEDGVARLGRAGAGILGLVSRGSIEPGAAADLVAFDPAAIRDRANYAAPRAHPDGIAHVLVNGRFVVRDGRETGERPGRVLRRGDHN